MEIEGLTAKTIERPACKSRKYHTVLGKAARGICANYLWRDLPVLHDFTTSNRQLVEELKEEIYSIDF
jgi:hypothetical protein